MCKFFDKKNQKKCIFSQFWHFFMSNRGQNREILREIARHHKFLTHKQINNMETKNLSTSERMSAMLKYAIVNQIISDKGEFAKLLGVNPSTVSRYLSGKKNPPESTLRKFNASFGNIFNEQWLLLGIGEMLNGQQPAGAIAMNTHAPVYQNTGKGGNNVTQNDVNGELLTIIHKRDEQIDRLLTIIEKMNQPQNIE